MNFPEQDFANQYPSSITGGAKDGNYYAFFDKPSPENLAANRNGILTSQQQEALQTNIAYQKTSNAIMVSTLALTVLFMTFLFWKIDSADGMLSIPAQLINAGVLVVVFSIFAGYLMGDLFVYSMRDDLENRLVQSGIGRMEWDGKRYRMRMDARTLRSFKHGRVLPPGDYRFYYLPHTGLVVMAEELDANEQQHASILLRTLASANGFSLDELKLNQEGLLSRHQENELVWVAVFALIVGLGGAAALLVLVPRIVQELSTTGLVLALIIGSVLLLRFGWDAARIISDVWHAEISTIEGPVSKKVKRSRYSHSYYYVSGPNQFQVSKTAYNALIEGKTYRIFYVPRSKRLISIEPA